ncbi:MAG: radical SAM protein [Anaerolineales bacterium]|nr:radical SAM protein [Anaerolineales bacterium]
MKLTGLHILLTYQCNFECDHCFVWGSPWQSGVMTMADIRDTLQQAKETGTVNSIYFEGGEPFLYYATLLKAVRMAHEMGFDVGIVSNGYWAISQEDAQAALEPFSGLLHDLSVSTDFFHYDEFISSQAKFSEEVARVLNIPLGTISIASPQESETCTEAGRGTLPPGESDVMYRGRAAVNLIDKAGRSPWESFTECPYEDLVEPGRIHMDPLGNLHICQGIIIGNIREKPLKEICAEYDPQSHPIVKVILNGGPAALVTQFDLPHEKGYADACHLCYNSRLLLREHFPELLGPDQMYGVNL